MNRLVTALNNRYLLAAIAGLFVLGFVKRIAGR
jgi:hypothetical protein